MVYSTDRAIVASALVLTIAELADHMAESSSGKEHTDDQRQNELTIEEQKKSAIETPGKSWHDWFLQDFLRYSFWPLVLVESLFIISIISFITGVSQYNPLLIGTTVAALLAVEYYFVYRRIWRRGRSQSDVSGELSGDIFDKIR